MSQRNVPLMGIGTPLRSQMSGIQILIRPNYVQILNVNLSKLKGFGPVLKYFFTCKQKLQIRSLWLGLSMNYMYCRCPLLCLDQIQSCIFHQELGGDILCTQYAEM